MGQWSARIISTNTAVIDVACHTCHQEFKFVVPATAVQNYRAGELIQRALPMLTNAERELLITNTCGKCWDKLFPPDEDD